MVPVVIWIAPCRNKGRRMPNEEWRRAPFDATASRFGDQERIYFRLLLNAL